MINTVIVLPFNYYVKRRIYVLGIDTVLADCCGFTKRLREKWHRQQNPMELAPEDFVDCVIFHEIFWCSHNKQPTRYQSLLWHNCNHGDKLIYAHFDSNYDITVTMVTNSFLLYSGSFLETIFSKLTGGFRYCRRCIEETLSTGVERPTFKGLSWSNFRHFL